MDMELRVETGLKKIKCNDYGDYITINVSDASILERFTKVYDNLEHVSDEFKVEAESYKEQFGDDKSRESVLAASRINVKYIAKCIEELEEVFGKDSIRKAFRECYEENPDFVPDESCLIEFMEQMVPVMEKLFNEKINKDKRKYSVGFKGKTK